MTSRRFTTGAPFTLAGSPVISAYPDNGTTQLTAGITLSVDFDGVTGLNNVRVVATAANGYAAGSNYDLVVTTGTVDSVSVVGEVVGSFSIEARSGLRPTVAARTLDVSAAGEAGLDWANVGSPTTVVGLSGTTIKTATDVEADTQDIQARLPAALVSGRVDASVGALNGSATAAQNLERSASSIYRGSVTATSTSTSLIDSGLTQSGTDHWKGRVVIFTSGTLAGQATDILAFTPASDTLTVTALTAAPATSDQFVIV